MSQQLITVEEIKTAKESIAKYLGDVSAKDLLSDFNKLLGLNETPIEASDKIQERIDLHFKGENVRWGMISARFLGNMVSGFQKIIDDLGNALANNASNVGRIPNELLRKTDLMVNAPYAASFGVVLTADIENTLYPEESLISRALNQFYKLLSVSDNEDAFCDEISALGSRVYNDYKSWFKELSEAEVNLKIDRYDVKHSMQTWEVNRLNTSKIMQILTSFDEPHTECIVIKGKLTGLYTRQGTFELLDENNIAINGKCPIEGADSFAPYMTKNVIVRLYKTTTRNTYTGKEKIYWYLDELKPDNAID